VTPLLLLSVLAAEAAPPSPPPPAQPPPVEDRGRFGGLWVVAVATHQFQGGGLEAGYRWRWLAGLYRVGFLQNGYAPVDGTPYLQRTQRAVFELEVDGELHLPGRLTVAGGPGVAFLADRIQTSEALATGWATSTRENDHFRPLVNVSLTGPLFETAVSFYVGESPEIRLMFGVTLWRTRPH